MKYLLLPDGHFYSGGAYMAHGSVRDDIVERVQKRVLDGMGSGSPFGVLFPRSSPPDGHDTQSSSGAKQR